MNMVEILLKHHTESKLMYRFEYLKVVLVQNENVDIFSIAPNEMAGKIEKRVKFKYGPNRKKIS